MVKVDEAADAGAKLVAFPEAFVPGYPEWVWRLRPGADFAETTEIWRRFLPQTVDLELDQLAPLRDAARRRSVTITLGINERDGSFSRATVYNTFVVIGPDGEILLRHRKLVPTNPERMVWGAGDGVGLETVETPLGLSCAPNARRRGPLQPARRVPPHDRPFPKATGGDRSGLRFSLGVDARAARSLSQGDDEPRR